MRKERRGRRERERNIGKVEGRRITGGENMGSGEGNG